MHRRALFASLAMLLAPLAAHAHAILIDSTPPIDGTVPAGPTDIRLRYNSRVDQARSKVTLTGPDHTTHVLKIDRHAPADVLHTTAALAAGPCDIAWQVLAIDGHITRGDVRFTVAP